MPEYKPNSLKYREGQQQAATEERKVEKVVTGAVKTKKKGEVRKLAEVFVPGDVKNVKSYVVMDVLVPAIKKAISDIVTNGIDMILYGETGRSKKRSSSDYVSYSRYSDKRDDRHSSREAARPRFDFDDIIYESRGEAEAVLEQMLDVIDRYKFITVGDMYDMAGLPQPYTSNKYGWTSLRTAETVRTRDGYTIKLPKAMPID